MLLSWSLMSAFFLIGQNGTVLEPPKQISVCEVLSNPKKYDHQMVTIRALLISSSGDTDFDELIPLSSESCFTRAQQDELAIGLGGGSGIPDIPKNFQPDWDSYERAGQALEKLREKNPLLKQLLVTVEGMIFDGGPEPSGVTRHPWHPAAMAISKWNQIREP